MALGLTLDERAPVNAAEIVHLLHQSDHFVEFRQQLVMQRNEILRDPLKFWISADAINRFPDLAPLAKAALSIPASSIAAESAIALLRYIFDHLSRQQSHKALEERVMALYNQKLVKKKVELFATELERVRQSSAHAN